MSCTPKSVAFLRRWPCWPGPYSRLLIGDFGRPHRLTPRRRLILYLLSTRLVICALPFRSVVAPVGRAARRPAGRGPEDPSAFPAVEGGLLGGGEGGCQTGGHATFSVGIASICRP